MEKFLFLFTALNELKEKDDICCLLLLMLFLFCHQNFFLFASLKDRYDVDVVLTVKAGPVKIQKLLCPSKVIIETLTSFVTTNTAYLNFSSVFGIESQEKNYAEMNGKALAILGVMCFLAMTIGTGEATASEATLRAHFEKIRQVVICKYFQIGFYSLILNLIITISNTPRLYSQW